MIAFSLANKEAVQRSQFVLVDGYEPEAALAMLDAASKAGCRSVLNVEIGDRETVNKLVPGPSTRPG